MGSFRIDPLTNAGVPLGGPITSALNVTRRQELDRYSSWEFDMSTSDPALRNIEGKDFDIYWLWGGRTFFLGRCSYLSHAIQASGLRVAVQATGNLRDLARQTVTQRSFDGATDDVNTVLSTIVPLRAGWSLGEVDTIAKAAPMDFWYESIFDSVALLAQTFGKHFREGANPKTLDFGAFGLISGVMALKTEALHPGIYAEKNRCYIQEVTVEYQANQVVNRLIAFGGAIGTATIDLSLVTSPQTGYPVLSAALPDGGLYYYIEDEDSISTYGLTERRFLRKDLRPISNSPAARTFAANVLYEASLASLLNLKDRQTIYSLSVVGLEPGRVRVGDKIVVYYRGLAQTSEGQQVWLNLDDESQPGAGKEFYVLELAESFGDGVATQLAINENAVKAERIEDILASTIRTFEQSQIHVQPTISRYTVGPYTKRVKANPSGVAASFSFKLGPETLTIWYIKITVTGEPLKSSVESIGAEDVTTPAGGGGTTPSGGGSTTPSGGGSTTVSGGGSTSGSQEHTHTIKVFGIGTGGQQVWFDGSAFRTSSLSGETLTDEEFPAHTHSTPSHAHATPDHTHSTPNHTHTTPNHTHSFTPEISTVYGIFEDSVRPSSLTIKVNGATVATGVTLSAGNSYTYEHDITANILAAGTLQQEHTITVECGSNRGEIQFQAQVLAVIQGIAVS